MGDVTILFFGVFRYLCISAVYFSNRQQNYAIGYCLMSIVNLLFWLESQRS